MIGAAPKVLILGTMPGRESLAKQQYYGNAQNAFWRVMEPWCGGAHLPYARRCGQLTAVQLALWDVLRECERVGSSDAAIAHPVPNEIARLVEEHPSLTHVLFNGQKARALFDRLCTAMPRELELVTLPSTSPANARAGKVEAWRGTLTRILG